MATSVSLNTNSNYTRDLLERAQNNDSKAINELCSGLYNATAGRLGTDEEYVNTIMQNADSKTLANIMDNYSAVTGSEIYKDIENDFSGKTENEILATLDNAYKEANNKEYTGWNDGKLSIQDTVKSVGKGLLNKFSSAVTTIGGVLVGKTAIGACISGFAGSALTAVFGAGAATVATFAAPVLAAVGVVAAGAMIYKGVTQTAQAFKDAQNATTDEEMKSAVQIGAEGVVDAGLGIYTGKESVKALKDSINNIKEFRTQQKQLKPEQEQQVQSETQAKIEEEKQITRMQNTQGEQPEIASNTNGEAIGLENKRIDKTGVLDTIESRSASDISGDAISKELYDSDFLEKMKPLGEIGDNGKLYINSVNGTKIEARALIEEINGQKVIHVYGIDGDYIASVYNGGIVPKNNFAQYLQSENGNIIFGQKFNPTSSSTEDLEKFYIDTISKICNKKQEIALQDAIDIFPTGKSVDIKDLSSSLTLGETNYTISDCCEFVFKDAGNLEWKIRVHSQDLSSNNKQWIFRLGHKLPNGESRYFDLSTLKFDGQLKGIQSQFSHIPVKGFYNNNEAILNDGNLVSYISYLSSNLNSKTTYSTALMAKIRNFALSAGITNPKSYGKGDIGVNKLLEAIMKKCKFETLEDLFNAIFS